MEDSGIDSDPKPHITINHTNDNKIFLTSGSNVDSNHQRSYQDGQLRCTTKQLQRKLEVRIEQAKRIQRSDTDYDNIVNSNCNTNKILIQSTGLIPIQRLSIPNHNGRSVMHHERYPLVEYWQSDTTESEGEITLFGLSCGKHENYNYHKQDLTDTFSIQESSEESEDSLNLIGPTTHQASHLHARNCKPIGCHNCFCHII